MAQRALDFVLPVLSAGERTVLGRKLDRGAAEHCLVIHGLDDTSLHRAAVRGPGRWSRDACSCSRKSGVKSELQAFELLDGRWFRYVGVALWPGTAPALDTRPGLPTRSLPVRPAHDDDRRQTSSLDGQSGYSSLRQARGSPDSAFGVRLSRNEWYGATNGSGAVTV